MDPQATNNLDPKLKETYDRVMGTTTQPGVAPAAPGIPPPAPAPVATATPIVGTPLQDNATNVVPPTEIPQNNGASIPQTPYTADNLSFQAAIQTPVNNPAPLGTIATPQQPSSLLRILYIVGGVVFFVVYTFVWVKIFNLPLPF